MNSSTTFSRAELQAVPAKRRADAIQSYVGGMWNEVYNSAAAGKTSHFHVLKLSRPMGTSYPPPYLVTAEDVLEGLKAKFPDCTVEAVDEWADVRPGVREQRTGIRIDWS